MSTHFFGHAAQLTSVAITSGDRFAVSGGWDGTAILWELDSPHPDGGAATAPLRPMGHSLFVRSADISGDGNTAVTSSDDHSLIVWSTESGAQLRTLDGHEQPVNSVRLSSDGAKAVSGDQDGTLILWDVKKGSLLSKIKTGGGRIHAVNLSPDAGSWLPVQSCAGQSYGTPRRAGCCRASGIRKNSTMMTQTESEQLL